MSKEQRQSWKLLEPRIFNVYKNVTVLMIVMLDHSEIDIKVSDTDMETVESNDCRGVSRDGGDTNNVLGITQEGASKDRWKFINLFT